MFLKTRRNSVVNNLLDAQFFFLNSFTSVLYMFRAALCSSSGESIYQYDIWYMSLCVGDRVVCRFICPIQTCIPHSYPHRATYTRCRIDTIDSPDDEHKAARNM